MAEIQLEIDGKTYNGKLSLGALEKIETQFNNMGLNQIIVQMQSVRVAKAIVSTCIMASNSGMELKEITRALNAEVEKNGLEPVWDMVTALVDASGFYGKVKASEATAKN